MAHRLLSVKQINALLLHEGGPKISDSKHDPVVCSQFSTLEIVSGANYIILQSHSQTFLQH
jgi:hypothetical protein